MVNYVKVHNRLCRAATEGMRVVTQSAKTAGAGGDMLVNVYAASVSKRTYEVTIGIGGCRCTCLDFATREDHGSPACKHIMVVMMHLFKANANDVISVMQDLEDGKSILVHLFRFKDGRHADPHRESQGWYRSITLDKTTPEMRGGVDNCCICLDPLEDSVMKSVCSACRNPMHHACITKWFHEHRYGPESCPLCTAPWADIGLKIEADKFAKAMEGRRDARRHARLDAKHKTTGRKAGRKAERKTNWRRARASGSGRRETEKKDKNVVIVTRKAVFPKK